jgi:hypothetical protein
MRGPSPAIETETVTVGPCRSASAAPMLGMVYRAAGISLAGCSR